MRASAASGPTMVEAGGCNAINHMLHVDIRRKSVASLLDSLAHAFEFLGWFVHRIIIKTMNKAIYY